MVTLNTSVTPVNASTSKAAPVAPSAPAPAAATPTEQAPGVAPTTLELSAAGTKPVEAEPATEAASADALWDGIDGALEARKSIEVRHMGPLAVQRHLKDDLAALDAQLPTAEQVGGMDAAALLKAQGEVDDIRRQQALLQTLAGNFLDASAQLGGNQHNQRQFETGASF